VGGEEKGKVGKGGRRKRRGDEEQGTATVNVKKKSCFVFWSIWKLQKPVGTGMEDNFYEKKSNRGDCGGMEGEGWRSIGGDNGRPGSYRNFYEKCVHRNSQDRRGCGVSPNVKKSGEGLLRLTMLLGGWGRTKI